MSKPSKPTAKKVVSKKQATTVKQKKAPTKTVTKRTRPAPKKAKPAVKAVKKRKNILFNHPELFPESEFGIPEPKQEQIKVSIEMPIGHRLRIETEANTTNSVNTPISINNGQSAIAPQQVELTPADIVARLMNMDKDLLQKAIAQINPTSQQIINLSTILHGRLYKFASIGSKISQSRRTKP